MTDVVWNENRYEAGSYHCQVVREGDHGRLSIVLTSGDVPVPLHLELVECERAETERWRTRCLSVIRNPELRSIQP
jgi:hypothetical protein